jgi:hypothetical protein
VTARSALPAVDDREDAPQSEQHQTEHAAGADAGVAPVESGAGRRGLGHLHDGDLRGAERAAALGDVDGVGRAQVLMRLALPGVGEPGGVTRIRAAQVLSRRRGGRARKA